MGVEDLDFVEAVDQDAVVSLIVPWALEVGGGHPFEVELEAAKFLFGAWGFVSVGFESAIGEFP
jgi:hypothetical protein